MVIKRHVFFLNFSVTLSCLNNGKVSSGGFVLNLCEARFRRRTLHVPNLIVLDATQERQWFKRRTKYNVIDKAGAHSPAKPK
jgi:hypothetical protein